MPASSHPPIFHSDALPRGYRLGEFELLRLLGVGGFGMVYQAYDHSLHRSVAIKEYMPAALAGRAGGHAVGVRSSLDGASYEAGLRSFIAEARLLAQFDHPSLVKVFRFWEAHNTAYMVMPLYGGMTLKHACSQMRHPPPEDWLRQVLWSVLQALQLLHDSQTVHRDVSPENIFLQDSGPPVLLDLGAARRAIGDLGPKHTAVLKVNYAPIEQYADARDMAQGPWSDLYALAAVVHGCVSQTLPQPATFRILRDRMPRMQAVVQSVPGRTYSVGFVDAIDQALAIRPEDRPQSVPDFVQALGLQSPMGIAQFDWRTAMGPNWQSVTGEREDQAHSDRMELATLPTQFVYPPRPSVEVALGGVDGARVMPRLRQPRAFALAALVALVAGMGVAMWKQLPAVHTRNHLALAPLEAVVHPVPDSPVVAHIVAEPVASSAVLAPVSVAPRRHVDQAREVRATAAPVRSRVAVKPPQPSRVTKRTKPAVELCTDSNFFTRPMCLHRECQKPALAALPVCVENTQRLLASQQPRR